jgi:hypothetical protein
MAIPANHVPYHHPQGLVHQGAWHTGLFPHLNGNKFHNKEADAQVALKELATWRQERRYIKPGSLHLQLLMAQWRKNLKKMPIP